MINFLKPNILKFLLIYSLIFFLFNNAFIQDKRIIFSKQALPEKIIQKISGKSFKKISPVSSNELAYLQLTYFGFDSKDHIGEMIVNKKAADEVLEIFRDLYRFKFPIDKIRLIDEYNADDEQSMENNNTSAFCVRTITGTTNKFSLHSYGFAIDINPLQNPYINKKIVLPSHGKNFINRSQNQKGMITKGDNCYNSFISRGWDWGGNWDNPKDYQHFEKKFK